MRRFRLLLFNIVLVALQDATFLLAQEPEPFISIIRPVDAAETSVHAVELIGRITHPLVPVIFVQPLVGRLRWYVQQPVSVINSEFRGIAFLGQSDKGANERYRLVCLALQRSEVTKLIPGTALETLPSGDATSPILTITRRSPGDSLEKVRPRRIRFSGYDWYVKQGEHVGAGANPYNDDPSQVYLDEQGHLHLAFMDKERQRSAAEVFCDRALGYGLYTWKVEGQFAIMHPNLVMGLFLYAPGANEIDFEYGRWGIPTTNEDAQFVIQPPSTETLSRFNLREARQLIVQLDWTQEHVKCYCWSGMNMNERPLKSWAYVGPRLRNASHESVHMNLWQMGSPPENAVLSSEVIIRSFDFKKH